MNSVTEAALWDLVNTRFHGVLLPGVHRENSAACALEVLSVFQEQPWTDDPTKVRTFDLRPLNDMAVEDSLRTRLLIPLVVRYAHALDWSADKQQHVVASLVRATVNRLIAELPHVPPAIAQRCRDATTLAEAEAAAWAAWAAEAATGTAWAAEAAAWAAKAAATWAVTGAAWAAEAAARAAEEAGQAAIPRIFTTTCQLWSEAAHVA